MKSAKMNRKSFPERAGQDAKREKTLQRRIWLLTLMMTLSFFASAAVVEAGPLDSLRSGWGQVRTYVLSMQFWVNALIIFGVLFILFTLTLKKSMGSDKTTMTVMYVIIGIAALIIATKVVASNGVPQYIWHNDNIRDGVQFLFGPSRPLGPCRAPDASWLRNIWSDYVSNPPCCGTGAYFKSLPNNPNACKQAILRTNGNGSGLPAFIIAAILFYLLFNGYGKNLGFDRTGKWMPIALSLILAALLANERITKNQILVIGGWVAVLLIGNKLSKSMTGDRDPKGTKKGFGFGLAYAFVSLILNMLGTSLWGGTVTAGEIGVASIFKNLIIGFAVGFIYSFFAGGGILGKIMDQRRKKMEKDIAKHIDDGKIWEPYLRSIPYFGAKHWSPKDTVKKKKADVETLSRQLDEVSQLYRLTADQDKRNEKLYKAINDKVKRIEDKIAETLNKGQ